MRSAAELPMQKPGDDMIGGDGIPGLAGKAISPGKIGENGNDDVVKNNMFALPERDSYQVSFCGFFALRKELHWIRDGMPMIT